eukprot:1161835-Pelagomonas_calceolata.AAC.3
MQSEAGNSTQEERRTALMVQRIPSPQLSSMRVQQGTEKAGKAAGVPALGFCVQQSTDTQQALDCVQLSTDTQQALDCVQLSTGHAGTATSAAIQQNLFSRLKCTSFTQTYARLFKRSKACVCPLTSPHTAPMNSW